MPKKVTRIRELRLAQDLTQAQLATDAGITMLTVGRLEHADAAGLDVVKLGTLRAIADALGVSVAQLIPSLKKRPNHRR